MAVALPRGLAPLMLVALGSTSGVVGTQQVRPPIGHDQCRSSIRLPSKSASTGLISG